MSIIAFREAIRKAFDMWSEASPLEFTEVSPSDSSADIKVRFASSDHGDPWPFDGRGAYIFFPNYFYNF